MAVQNTMILVLFAALAMVPSSQAIVQTTMAETAAYMTTFERQIAGVVLEERYVQGATARTTQSRVLVSDLVVVADDRFRVDSAETLGQ